MSKLDYIVIDFETANWSRSSACSVGLVRFIDGRETDSLNALIKPPTGFFIKEWTETIHGLSYDDVRNEPYFPDIWQQQVMPFINKTPNLPLVAHNATFDMSVIKGCCDHYEMAVPNIRYFDSLPIARKTWPELKSHKLTYLGAHFGIEYKAHDALEDSRTCGLIVNLAADKWKVTTVEGLVTCCKCQIKPLVENSDQDNQLFQF